MTENNAYTDGIERSITNERGQMQEDIVCSILDALEPDDEIHINDRARPLRVLGFEEDRHKGLINGSDYPYHILWLRGNGTEYRLRWSHTADYYPHLHTESELETRESYSVKHGEVRQQTISLESGERVTYVSVVDVPDEQLTEFVIARQIDGVEDYCVDTGGDQQ